MKPINQLLCVAVFTLLINAGETVRAQENPDQILEPIDVFQMETASDPQISPDGQKIVYVRNFMDIMTDKQLSNLWIINFDGTGHRPLTTGNESHNSPRWSPNGERLLYVSNADDSSQVYIRWMDTGQTAKISNLIQSPGGLTWSADGKWIAFSMRVLTKSKPWVDMPTKPDKAKWAPPAKVIDKLLYRADGKGYLKDGFNHLFVLPADGGTPRQV
ncbi:MAG: S9 family peptidase, partial [Planctomycetes bacterium]|nr:S9 family peptidase [Planctomycetota bacterium]